MESIAKEAIEHKNLSELDKKFYDSLVKKCVFILSSSSCFLDGFALLFLSYNSPIMKSVWSWDSNSVFILNAIYHLMSGFGAFLSTFSSQNGYKEGLYFGSFISLLTLFFSFPLLFSNSVYAFYLAFFFIFFSTGHNLNICTNLLIEQFDLSIRAPVFALAMVFNQIGKFIFACIILSYYKEMNRGELLVSVIPIFVCVFLIFITLRVFIKLLNTDYVSIEAIRKEDEWRDDNIQSIIDLDSEESDSLQRHYKSKFTKQSLYESCESTPIKSRITSKIIDNEEFQHSVVSVSNSGPKEIYKFNSRNNSIPSLLDFAFDVKLNFSLDMKKLVIKPISLLFSENNSANTSSLLLLNFSLAMQFFLLAPIYPLISDFSSMLNIVDRILYSKVLETIGLSLYPLLFLIKKLGRKDLLLITYLISLLLIFRLIFNIGSIDLTYDLIRFVWICSFITVNMYTVESTSFELRGFTTSIMTLCFQVGCFLSIMLGEYLASKNIYISMGICLVLLILDILIISKFMVETHFLSVHKINNMFKSMH